MLTTAIKTKAEVEQKEMEWGNLQLYAGPHCSDYGMTFGRITIKPGQGIPKHYHPDAEEILYVVEGELMHTIPEGGTVLLKAGDSIMLPRIKPHAAWNEADVPCTCIVSFNNGNRTSIICDDAS